MALMTIDWNPPAPKLRQFAVIAGGALLTLAVWAYFRHGGLTGAAGLAVIGLALGLCGARWPRGVRPLYVGMMIVTFPIGWVVSHLVLAVLYFGVFTSVALIFLLIGRDVLRRRFEPSASSYWEPKVRNQDPRRYLQQF